MKREVLEGLGLNEEQINAVLGEHNVEVAEVKDKLASAREEVRATKAAAEDKIIANAISRAIGDTAMDTKLVAGLIDRGKLNVDEEGEVLGIDEQLTEIRENKAFLFKENVISGIKPVPADEPKAKTIDEMNYTELCKYLEENPNADI